MTVNNSSANKKSLKRQLGFWDSVAINVGVVIGVGIFRTPGSIAQHLDSSGVVLLVWIMGGFIAMLGVFCYAELSSAYPHTGGTYVYLREAFGRPLAFVFGWAEFSILRAGSIAGVAYILTDYLQNVIPFSDPSQKLVTVVMIWIFTGINIFGIHLGTKVQNWLSALKIVGIFLISGLILSFFKEPNAIQISSDSSKDWMGFAPALIPVLWTYGGWHQSTFMSGEFNDTKKALPLSLFTGILIVMGVYLLMNFSYLRIFTPAEMAGTKAIASDAIGQLFGPAGKMIVTFAVLISASGALNSTILTGGRIPFAVAHDHPKLSWFAHVDHRFETPLRSLVLNSIWASVLVMLGNFDQLMYFFAFANWLFFALVGMTIFKFRKMEKLHDGYVMWGYPVIPILFVISAIALCVITVLDAPMQSLYGAGLLIFGLPIYWLFRTKA